jgi:anti-sigma factor (TIGR02949 family)
VSSNATGSRPADAIDCEAALSQLGDYLKHELTPDLAARVRAHVADCAPCFRELRFAERFLTLLQSSGAGVQCPDPLRIRIAEALRAESSDH